jgi:hypothetical protein
MPSKLDKLQAIAAELNARQRAYLLAVYEVDQSREAAQGPGGPPASVWRLVEYGPVGAKFLSQNLPVLRNTLERDGLVDQGTGSTWTALSGRKLLTTSHHHTGFIDAFTKKPIVSLMLRMTTDGRKVARILKGEPLTKAKVEKPLSLSGLRLIAYGQANPGEEFDNHAPWGMCPIDYLTILGICRGLIKRGLLAGEAPHAMRITETGMALDVTSQPKWKPAPAGRS